MRPVFYTTCHLNGSPYSLGATSDGIVFIENTPIDDVTKRHWLTSFLTQTNYTKTTTIRF